MQHDCQKEVGNKDIPEDVYYKLNLLSSSKPWLPSNSLNGKKKYLRCSFCTLFLDKRSNSKEIILKINNNKVQETISLIKSQAEMSVRVKDALQFIVENNLSITCIIIC